MRPTYDAPRNQDGVAAEQLLTGGRQLAGQQRQDIHVHSTVQRYDLGTRLVIDDRVFRYCFAGTALNGMLQAHNGNGFVEGNLDANAYAVDDQVVTILDTTARVVNYYRGGYIWIMKSGDYQFHRIASSPVSAGTSVALTLEEPLRVTLLASTWFTAWRNIYSNIVSAENAKQSQVAVPLRDVANGSYFWGQTWGPCFGTVHATVPGIVGNQRDVYFSEAGALMAQTDHDLTVTQRQRAGFIITDTSLGGDQFYMLQISP